MATSKSPSSLKNQIEALHAERAWMSDQLGISDPEGVVRMVQSLEAQLHDLYSTYGGSTDDDLVDADTMIGQINRLAERLDGTYSEKSVVLEFNNATPTLKAVWTERTTAGGTNR
ncbi:MAG: hypothetical protein AB8G96_05955 [Phycisphaerales bacterium]